MSRVSWRDARLVVVDVETTGLDPRADQVISFGAVPIVGGRACPGQAVYGLVRPNRAVPVESIRIHGIRPHDLRDAPQPPEAFAALADAMRGNQLVAHAAWVERSFLAAPLRGLGIRLPRRLLDTAQLWRLLCIERDRGDPGFCQLGEIAAALGLPAHRPHHALGDALTTAQVFLALATHLERHGRTTVATLRSADRLVRTFRMFHPRGLG